jgi:predicted enzyme related to lactoylglutathione lyase
MRWEEGRVGVSYTFTKMLVSNLDVASAFYAEVFGLEVAHRIEKVVGRDRMEEVFLATGDGPTLALVCYPDRDVPPTGELVLGFSTDDIAELFERATRRGATVARPPSASEATHGYAIGILADPDGHRVEVVELS